MEEEESASKKMRIYVGGLGAAMTEDDLRKAFQSVGGVVEAVDFVRTKARSFAYVDFFPSSQSSISKLFSTYNGCAWKGGKLRLEKAKEHYLARLKREWEEDAQIENSYVSADLEVSAPESTEHVTKSEHIEIFFPSLGEVKSLPLSGTGTHKYDFPHFDDVPSLPVHFCDCEEHNVSAPIGNAKQTKTGDLDAENGGMGEDELQMMNAVMNKLFERRDASEANCNGAMAVKDKERSKTSTENQQLEDSKVDSDEDNLVLNVMASDTKSKIVPLNSGSKSFEAHRNNKGAATARDNKSNSRVQGKKRKSVTSEEFDGNEYVPNITAGNENGSINPANEPVRPPKPQAPERAVPIQCSRSQKSSWKTLIRDKSNVSFSISDILPSISSANDEQAEAEDLNLAHSNPDRNSDLATAAALKSKKDETKPVKSNVSFSIADVVLPSVPLSDQEQTEAGDLNLAHSNPNSNSKLATAAALKSKKDETKSVKSNVSFSVSDVVVPSVPSADQEQAHSTPTRNTDFTTDAIPESKSEETKSMESFPEAEKTIPNVTSNKGRGSSWRQKSSWTQLVSEEITSFSITQILPNTNNTSESQVQKESDATDVNLSARNENDDSQKQDNQCITEDDSAAFEIRKDETAWTDVKKNEQSAVQENSPSSTKVIESNLAQQAGSFDIKSEETCPFMRNSRSVAEWPKIKAAFSGGSKKKKQRQQ